jgi:hypothetical protein
MEATGLVVIMAVMEVIEVTVGMVGMEGMAVMAEAVITFLATLEANTLVPTPRVSPPVPAMEVAGQETATLPARPVLLPLHTGEWEPNS